MKANELLPIGSVIWLKEAEKPPYDFWNKAK